MYAWQSISIKMNKYEHGCEYEFDFESEWVYACEYEYKRKYKFVASSIYIEKLKKLVFPAELCNGTVFFVNLLSFSYKIIDCNNCLFDAIFFLWNIYLQHI